MEILEIKGLRYQILIERVRCAESNVIAWKTLSTCSKTSQVACNLKRITVNYRGCIQ